MSEMAMVMHRVSPGGARRATWQGRPHVVVPAVLVISQVLHNNLGASYLPADEINADWADAWNGIPVLIGDHPQQHGENVSGRDPGLLEERLVGWIFNARVEREGRDGAKLVAEVWLDESRAAVVQGFRDVLDAVQAGRAVELSTGFRTRTEETSGQFDGESYELIMHPGAPDHLVVSLEMTGACAVSDGCGLGVHVANCNCGGAHGHKEVGMKGSTTRLAYDMRLAADDYAAPTPLDASLNVADAFPEDTKNPIGDPHGDAKITRRRRATELERAIKRNRKLAKANASGSAEARARWDVEYGELSSELAAIRDQERAERDQYGQF